MTTMMRTTTLALVLAATIGCKSKSKLDKHDDVATSTTRSNATSADDPPPPEEDKPSDDGKDESGGTGAAMALDEGKMGKKDSARAEGQYKMKKTDDADLARPASAPAAKPVEPKKTPEKADKKGEAGETSAPTRAWFPETFLFEPLVVTDDRGAATVPVRVPDRLTTWRVLALAHARNGAQGGAVTSFVGTLPAYVDPIVPKTLIVGDDLRVPIQLVNTTDKPLSSTLATTATNATVTGATGARTIPAQGNLVDYARLVVDHPGLAQVKVGLGATDAVLRAIDVRPAGKPIATTRGGTLAAPRTLTITGPAASDPATDRVHLLAFPGALALLRSELGVSTYRQGVADDAYALLLAGRAPALLAALGDKPDADALRTLTILVSQRAIRDGRALDDSSAALLLEAARAHPDNPVLARLADRALTQLDSHQHPDGTFGGADGWKLQRLLVSTAEAVRAIRAGTATDLERQRAQRTTIRAQGVFERNLGSVDDAYTAAAILASGAVDGAVADKLKAIVLAEIKTGDDGAKYLDPPARVQRTDGLTPGRAEATALAVLGLAGDPKAPLADLGATLLGTYALDSGWGDGRANLVAMRAVLDLFKAPMPDKVTITLLMDGKPIVDGVLTKERIREVLVLDEAAPGIAGTHAWKVVAEPAVPGLGFSLSLQSWVPWPKEPPAGLELSLITRGVATVGKPLEIVLAAVAPSGTPLHVLVALPAGVQVDLPSVEALVTAGTVSRFETAEGKLELFAPGLQPGQTFAGAIRVIPTLAGKLHAPPSSIEAAGQAFVVPPVNWEIR